MAIVNGNLQSIRIKKENDLLNLIFTKLMAIEPEVITSSSYQGKKPVRNRPRWAMYGAGGIGVLLAISLIKSLLPLFGMGLLLAFIWSQATKPS